MSDTASSLSPREPLNLDHLRDHARIHDGLGRGDSLALIHEAAVLRDTLNSAQPSREEQHAYLEAMGWINKKKWKRGMPGFYTDPVTGKDYGTGLTDVCYDIDRARRAPQGDTSSPSPKANQIEDAMEILGRFVQPHGAGATYGQGQEAHNIIRDALDALAAPGSAAPAAPVPRICRDCGKPENNHPYRHNFVPVEFSRPAAQPGSASTGRDTYFLCAMPPPGVKSDWICDYCGEHRSKHAADMKCPGAASTGGDDNGSIFSMAEIEIKEAARADQGEG